MLFAQDPAHMKPANKDEKFISIDPHIFETNRPPKFEKQPKNLSEYYVTYDRKLHLGRMNARRLHDEHLHSAPNSFCYDLNEGFEKFDPKEGDEKLTMLLEWIRQMSPEGGNLKKAIHEADFICWRGLLTKISTTIYVKEEGWKLRAVRRKNVIFLCEEKTDAAKQREAEQTDRDKIQSYYGHKFEQYIAKNEEEEQPNTSLPVSTKEEFAVVCRNDIVTDTRLNPSKRTLGVLYSGEVDCIDKHGNLVEIKTQLGDFGPGFWKYSKSLKWWLQSSLVNVDQIVVGHRDENGMVTSMSAMGVREMLQYATWNFRACFELTSTVLTHIYGFLEKEGDACTVEYSGGGIRGGLKMRKIPTEQADFVPDSFLKHYY